MQASKIKVSLGPVTRYPSWQYHEDIAETLKQWFDISYFSTTPDENCDIAFFVKIPPVNLPKKCRYAYIPIDYFTNVIQIKNHAEFLSNCNLILINNERLNQYFYPYCKNIKLIHHYNKYTLTVPISYKKEGYCVCVNDYTNLPVLVEYLKKNPIGIPIKFLTNNVRGKSLNIPDKNEVIEWSLVAQAEVMANSKCSLDIKGLDFNSKNKPLTKAFQFISSNIPFATNKENYAVEYFKNHYQFNIRTPEDKEWLSLEYHKETENIASILRKELTIESVTNQYKDIILGIVV